MVMAFEVMFTMLITNSLEILIFLQHYATAFLVKEEAPSFYEFKSNRLVIAHRVAKRFYGNRPYEIDDEGYPKGYGKTSQAVLLPAFLSAYSGLDAQRR